MYISELDGAKLVVWKPKTIFCPPDCGGEEFDKVDYEAHCPECDRAFTSTDNFKFCPNCGTKIWLEVSAPVVQGRK
ncbi:MAG: hypothetical protein IJI23_07205 [Lachnospiraceae bacterium]|nr:hypothetical protein [Lachnospiraceae bacterium]